MNLLLPPPLLVVELLSTSTESTRSSCTWACLKGDLSLLAKVKLVALFRVGFGDVEVEGELEWDCCCGVDREDADADKVLAALRVSPDKFSLVNDCSRDITLVWHSSPVTDFLDFHFLQQIIYISASIFQ